MSGQPLEPEDELDRLEATVHEEAELARRALRSAVNALVRRDAELADEVIAFDDEVDRRYRAVTRGVEAFLARRRPVATDLRLALALLHVSLHAERLADYCVTIAKLTKLVGDAEPDGALLEAFEEMGGRAEEMIVVAVESLAGRDRERAESLVELDELIDRANRRAVDRILALGGDERQREWGLRMILVSRCLERIGDHAVDIGEQAAYVATGEFREFTDASRR
ncbi:MAG: phosphate signaling complex protein PhoU [Actinomycetota bacterium]|nr:phosphate signaling complex protein PhoU [Actinomycetota bacterium]